MKRAYAHCFGRFAKTRGYQEIMVGSNEAFGQLPTTLEVIALEQGVMELGFGTGASKLGDEMEAEVAVRLMMELYKEIYNKFGSWPRFSRSDDSSVLQPRVAALVARPRVDIMSKNTVEELELARAFMDSGQYKHFIGITCPSHLPRCAALADRVFHKSGIRVSWVQSETHYAGAAPGAPVVFEPPHRTDDPLLLADIDISQVMREFWKQPDLVEAARQVQQLFARKTAG